MKKWPWLILSCIILLIDQLAKYLALTFLTAYQPLPFFPMVNLTLAYNTGAAFSFLNTAGEWHHWFFVLFSMIVSILLIIWLVCSTTKTVLQSAAISLILGGALGNLYDRVVLGHVIDFIEVYYKNFHWPVFNLADSAICTGGFLLLIDLCKHSRREHM